jgi:ribosome-associated translation inhibitor RaiA
MTIQFNTDKTIKWDERHEEHFTTLITEGLKRYSSHLTRLEIHLSDENGAKDGFNNIRCMMEARMEGRQPIAATAEANSEESAIKDATNKLSASLKTIIDQLTEHKR